MSSQAVKATTKQVRPILSTSLPEARRRVLNLYRAWSRQLPYIAKQYDVPKSPEQLRAKLREEFVKNKHVKDIRVIDMLVVKGQMELKETVEFWKQKTHLMAYFKDTVDPKPKDFMTKFMSGHE